MKDLFLLFIGGGAALMGKQLGILGSAAIAKTYTAGKNAAAAIELNAKKTLIADYNALKAKESNLVSSIENGLVTVVHRIA